MPSTTADGSLVKITTRASFKRLPLRVIMKGKLLLSIVYIQSYDHRKLEEYGPGANSSWSAKPYSTSKSASTNL